MTRNRLIVAVAIAGALTVGGTAAMADAPAVDDVATDTSVVTPIAARQQLRIQDPGWALVEPLHTRQQVRLHTPGVSNTTATQTRLQIQDPEACDCDGDHAGYGYGYADGDCDGTGPDGTVQPLDGTGYQHGVGTNAPGPGARGRS